MHQKVINIQLLFFFPTNVKKRESSGNDHAEDIDSLLQS